MATKRKKGDIDLGANFGLLLGELGPQRLAQLGLAKQLVDRLGPAGFLESLSAEQREAILRHLQADSPTKQRATPS